MLIGLINLCSETSNFIEVNIALDINYLAALFESSFANKINFED